MNQEKEKYESPRMTFEEVAASEAVANTCWGYHGTDTKLYADLEGKGYASFQIGGGSCTLNLIHVTYYEDTETYSEATPAQQAELETILRKSGGESGNPYSGEGSVVIPNHPSDKWS